MVNDKKLDFWVKNNYNVLFIGKHGVGKTAIVKETFERNNLRWKYFSASTLDPWVDLVGVPKEKTDENGVNYLDLVRPKELQYDTIDAIFFDELNRSHKKVRNAVMELLQFKSINGKKFENLKLIWAAINPEGEDEEYDVETLDPAQKDRFQIHVKIDYKPDVIYFKNKYGKNLSTSVISWWNDLPKEQKNEVSPRRLDYLSDIIIKNGDIRDVIPESSNVKKLLDTIKYGPIDKLLEELYESKDKNKVVESFKDINIFNYCIESIKNSKDKEYIKFYLNFLSKESLTDLITTDQSFYNLICKELDNLERIDDIVDIFLSIINSQTNKILAKKITDFLKRNPKYKIIVNNKNNVISNCNIGTNIPKFKAPLSSNVTNTNMLMTFVKNFINSQSNSKRYSRYNSNYNSLNRKNFIDQLKIMMIDTFDVNDALLILDSLKIIFLHSQVNTIIKNNLMGIFNICIKNIGRVTSLDYEKVKNNFLIKTRHNDLFAKIISSNLLCAQIENNF